MRKTQPPGLRFYLPHTEPLEMERQSSQPEPYDLYDPYVSGGSYQSRYHEVNWSNESSAPNTNPLEDEQQLTLSLQLVPDHALAQLLPAQTGEHAFIAISPMYTRPRPLIPLQRIIGGFVSLFVVCALLCSGSIYYAQSRGFFATVSRIYVRPKNIPPTVWAKLPDPPERTDKDHNGPAAGIISSATTTGRYDPRTYMALEPQTKFATGQTIYLTFSVQMPKQDGRVVARWYTNNHYFLTQTSNLLRVKDVPSGSSKNGLFSMRYLLPAEGKVELYWNNQWAQTLYFVVNV